MVPKAIRDFESSNNSQVDGSILLGGTVSAAEEIQQRLLDVSAHLFVDVEPQVLELVVLKKRKQACYLIKNLRELT